MSIEQALGLGALASVVAGLVKKIPGFPDGAGGLVAVGLNVLIYAVLAFGGQLGWDLSQIDSVAGALAAASAVILPFVVSVAGSVATHKVTRQAIPKGTSLLDTIRL